MTVSSIGLKDVFVLNCGSQEAERCRTDQYRYGDLGQHFGEIGRFELIEAQKQELDRRLESFRCKPLTRQNVGRH